MAIATLSIDLVAKLANIERDLGRASDIAERNSRRMVAAFKTVSAAFAGAFSVSAIKNQISAISAESEKLERNLLRTSAVLNATGNAAGLSADQLQEMARQLALATLQSTEGVMQAQQVLLSYSNIQGEAFGRTLELAADLSTLMGTGLVSATETLAKALDAPAERLTSLTRIGFTFTGQQKDLIESLVDTNKTLEAQKIILDVVTGSFGGLARAEAMGYAGAMDTLAQRVQEARIALGEMYNVNQNLASIVNLVADRVSNFTDALKDSSSAAEALARVDLGVLNTPIQAATVFAANLSFVLKGVGNEIGGIAAQLGQLVQFNFSGVSAIRQMMVADARQARAELDALENRIMNPRPITPRPAVDLTPGQTAGVSGGGSPATGGRGGAAAKIIDEQQKIFDGIQRQIGALQEQAATFGASERATTLYRLSLQGATEAQLENAGIVLRELEILKERATLQERAKQLYEQTRTPIEQLNIELAGLNDLLDAGAITWDTYGRAVFDAQDRFDSLTEQVKETKSELDDFAAEAARNIQQSFADFLFNPFDQGLGGMLRNFDQMIQRMIAQAVAADLARRMFGDAIDGGSGSGLFGGALKWLGSNVLGISGERAAGGPVSAGKAYLVGERGPELIVPNNSGQVIPNHQLKSGQTINLTVNVASGTPQEVRRAAGAGAREAIGAFSRAQRYA